MNIVQNKSYNGVEIAICQREYRACRFEHCVLVYQGGVLNLPMCRLHDCRWRFDGAASRTVKLLGDLYGSAELAVQDAVESVLSYITGSQAAPVIHGIVDEENTPPEDGFRVDDRLVHGQKLRNATIVYAGAPKHDGLSHRSLLVVAYRAGAPNGPHATGNPHVG